MKTVFITMVAEVIHNGHIKLINAAKKEGKVIIGLKSDELLKEIHETCNMSYENREEALSIVECVTVIKQSTLAPIDIYKDYNVDAIMHGDDWIGSEEYRLNEKLLPIINVPYSKNISQSKVNMILSNNGIGLENRISKLKNMLSTGKCLKFCEAHNATSALCVEHSESDGKRFDGFWSSSLTDSTMRGKPDIELVPLIDRIETTNEIYNVASLPMIFDADTGRETEHFKYTVTALEHAGVSAVVIEDKTGLKQNSLFGNDVPQTQDTIENFCAKISAGKSAQKTRDFMIFARIESLILEQPVSDVLERADAYVKAGADGIMIHSRDKDTTQIFEAVKGVKALHPHIPIMLVPTSFNQVTIEEFEAIGVDIIIYANHMLRASYNAMETAAEEILKNGRTMEIEPKILKIKKILNLMDM